MQLAILRESLADFNTALQRGWTSGLEPLYETLGTWQAHWPPPTPAALPETLDQCLVNHTTRAFWQGHAYDPKAVLMQLAAFAPEAINLAFGRLFATENELSDRFRGFVHYLDEILGELARNQPLKAPATHHHDDYRAPSLYCTLRHPEDHAYFEADLYQQALRIWRARNISPVADPTRFAKTTKVVLTFMGKEEGLFEAQAKRTAHTKAFPKAALLVSEYLRFLAAT